MATAEGHQDPSSGWRGVGDGGSNQHTVGTRDECALSPADPRHFQANSHVAPAQKCFVHSEVTKPSEVGLCFVGVECGKRGAAMAGLRFELEVPAQLSHWASY